MHDLIMKRQLFHDLSEPFAVLVEAVKTQQPVIHAIDVSPDVVLLAKNCLLKAPEARLQIVNWKDFDLITISRQKSESARERVTKRSLIKNIATGNILAPQVQRKDILQRIANHLDSTIRNVCIGDGAFPPLNLTWERSDPLLMLADFGPSQALSLSNRLSIRFSGEIIDESTLTTRIQAFAFVSPVEMGAPEFINPVEIYRGPLDSNSLHDRISEVMYSALDIAQQHGLVAESVLLDLNAALDGEL